MRLNVVHGGLKRMGMRMRGYYAKRELIITTPEKNRMETKP